MSKATQDTLAELHSKLASQMLASLNASSEAATLLSKDRDEELPEDIVEFLCKLKQSNPALLTAVAKFLKDNEITADVSENDANEMTELQKHLASKRKRIAGLGFDMDE